MRHAIPSLAITLVLWTLMYIGGIYGRLGLSDRPTPVFLPPKRPPGWCHQRSEGSWVFALQFVVHLEIHRGSPSSPSSLGCWTKYGERTQTLWRSNISMFLSVPSLFFSFPPSFFPLIFCAVKRPLKIQLGDLGSSVIPPVWYWAKPQPTLLLVHLQFVIGRLWW